MDDRSQKSADQEVLPARVAERLLKRASELDEIRSAGSAVAELRAAAAEAGISTDAFNAALGELQQAVQTPVPAPGVRARRWRGLFFGLGGAVTIVLLAAIVVIPRLFVSGSRAPVPANMTVATVQLNCIPSSEAIDLVGPILTDPANTVVANSGSLGRNLTIRATPEQLTKVRAALDQVDNATSCVRR